MGEKNIFSRKKYFVIFCGYKCSFEQINVNIHHSNNDKRTKCITPMVFRLDGC